MSYYSALEAAGAEVHEFEEFGSYQGDWFALVTYEGVRGWVHGSYGSCSGCDAFQSEFDYESEYCDDHRYSNSEDYKTCEACDVAYASYKTHLADFGRSYLESLMTQEEAETYAARNIEWDSDAEDMLAFVKRYGKDS